MKTKIVYSVVSGFEDVYLPQAMVAAYTARKSNPTADIVLVVDQDTEIVIKEKLPNIIKYVSEVLVVHVPENFGKMHRSRYLKTTLRQNLKGDFLFVDADTVVTDDLSSIDGFEADIACVLDRHSAVSEHEHSIDIQSHIAPLSLNISDLKDKYFNSGVMYVKDTAKAHQLFEKWHEFWRDSLKKASGIDQPALAKANMQCSYPIIELDGIWNCQLSDNFINYFSDAKILHYFASNKRSPYLLYDNEIFKEVMEVGDVPQWLIRVLENPQKFFKPHHVLVYGGDINFMKSHVCALCRYHPILYKVLELFSKIVITKKISLK